MNVQDLINELMTVDDKTLPVRLSIESIEDNGDYENYWLSSLEEHSSDSSGYEVSGEVNLIAK